MISGNREECLAFIAEDIASIHKACDLMTTAISKGRFIEADGWLNQIKKGAGSLDDNLEGFLDEETKAKLGLDST